MKKMRRGVPMSKKCHKKVWYIIRTKDWRVAIMSDEGLILVPFDLNCRPHLFSTHFAAWDLSNSHRENTFVEEFRV